MENCLAGMPEIPSEEDARTPLRIQPADRFVRYDPGDWHLRKIFTITTTILMALSCCTVPTPCLIPVSAIVFMLEDLHKPVIITGS